MPTRWSTFPIKFEGGLITNLGRIEQGIQAPGSATILQNFEPSVRGGYDKILGFTKFSSTLVPGTGLVFSCIALADNEVLALRNNTYYYGTGTTWTSKGTAATGGIARTKHDTYKFGVDRKTVIVDSVNKPAFFNHTSKTLIYSATTVPEVIGASQVCVFKNHIFYAKSNILSFAAPYTDDDFTPANGAGSINIGDTIVGIVVFREQLIIFCLNSIYRLAGNSEADFALQPITRNTGCLSGNTIQEVGGDIMYLGPDGVRYLSATERIEDFGLNRASERIQTLISQNNLVVDQYSSVTLSAKNQYRLYIYKNATAATVSEGYLATKYSNQSSDDIAWAKLVGNKVYDMSKVRDTDNEFIVFVSDTGYVYRLESGSTYDGTPIQAIFETPYMPITDPKKRKTFYKHTLYARPTSTLNLMASLKFDYVQANASPSPVFEITGGGNSFVYGNPSTVYGSAIYGAGVEEQYYNNTIGSGFVVAVRYEDSSTSAPFNLNFCILEYRENERN